ncbi:hypothetical protein Taro_000896, partial [Colocasia esculenta]|nr:hypothetical protein [Colocasia esculenta]
LDSFSMLPSPVWYVCGLWVASRWSIPWIYPSSGVATAVCITTPEGVIVSRRTGTKRWHRDALGCPPAGVPPSDVCSSPTLGVQPAPPLAPSLPSGPWTPILASLLRECSGLRACSSWQPSWQTLERRGKRGLDSGAESFLELFFLGWDVEVVEVFSSQCGPDSPLSHCLSLHWFWSHVVVLGVGPQLGQAAVLHAFVCFCGGSDLLFCGGEAGARLASREHGRHVPLLAASGSGLVVVVVTTFPSVIHCPSLHGGCSLAFRSPFLGASLWWHLHVWFPDLAVCSGSEVVLLVGPRPCGGLRCPCLWGSSSRELGVGWVAETTVVSCVVSSSESECCELLYLSELRVVLCKFSGFVCVLQEGCSCCHVACVVSVVAQCVHAVVARLAVDSLAVLLPVWRTIAGKSRRVVSSGEVLLEFFSVGSGEKPFVVVLVRVSLRTVPCPFLSIVVLPQDLRCAVGLAGAFWRWDFVCPHGSDGLFCFPMLGVLSQMVV